MAVIIKGDNNGLAVDGDVKIDKLDFVFGEGVKSASGVSTVRADAEEVAYEEVAGEEEKLCNKEIAVSPHLPEVLKTKRAKRLLDIAVSYGVLTADYQKAKGTTVWQLGGVADRIGELLELPNKWVVFSELFGKTGENLRQKWFNEKTRDSGKEFSRKILNKIY